MATSLGTDAYLRGALASSTRKAYATAIKGYVAFCAGRGWQAYPLRADYAAEWLTAMAEEGGRTASTITMYKSALHTHFADQQSFADHAPNPLSHPKLRRLLTGISNAKAAPERATRSTAPSCQPLTFDVVRELRAVHTELDPREVMMYAAIAFATAAAVRPSELLGSSEYPERALRADQVTFYTSTNEVTRPGTDARPATHCVLQLDKSKTNLGMRHEARPVGASEAVQALWRWYLVSGAHGQNLLFQLPGRRPLTTSALVGHLRRKLKEVGRGGMRVTGKCFRQGGASTLAALGVPAADIASAGGWAAGSTVWKEHYAHFPEVQRARAVQVNAQMQRAAAAARGLGTDSAT